MGYEEQETQILINQADLKEGFFTFGTSRQCDYNKLIRKVGESRVLNTRISHDPEGNPVYWSCKVDRGCPLT